MQSHECAFEHLLFLPISLIVAVLLLGGLFLFSKKDKTSSVAFEVLDTAKKNYTSGKISKEEYEAIQMKLFS